MCWRNLNSLWSCWDHWQVTPSKWQGGHLLTTYRHTLNIVWYFNWYPRDCSWICSALFHFSSPSPSYCFQENPQSRQINKFKWLTDNPPSPKRGKSRLEEHIDRSLTELNPPLHDLPPRSCCSTVFRKAGGGDTARGGLCYRQKSSCRFWSSTVCTPFAVIKPNGDTRRKRFLIHVKIVCWTGDTVHESVNKLKKKKPKNQKEPNKKTQPKKKKPQTPNLEFAAKYK